MAFTYLEVPIETSLNQVGVLIGELVPDACLGLDQVSALSAWV